jgi:hypothetical protein
MQETGFKDEQVSFTSSRCRTSMRQEVRGEAQIERLQRDGELRERALNQGESARMSY